MQVVSGRHGKEKVHYEAPPASNLYNEFDKFLDYTNNSSDDDLIKAAIVHLWFLILHPFDDGNGRIARALTEIFLKRSDKSEFRFYSMTSQLMKCRSQYYEVLEATQKSSLNITNWIIWFLDNLQASILNSTQLTQNTEKIAAFWLKNSEISFNDRQRKIILMLHNGFRGNLTSGKWAKICKCSQDTASRDINDLIEKDILEKSGQGRSTHYLLKGF
jgi:Fic family protein